MNAIQRPAQFFGLSEVSLHSVGAKTVKGSVFWAEISGWTQNISDTKIWPARENVHMKRSGFNDCADWAHATTTIRLYISILHQKLSWHSMHEVGDYILCYYIILCKQATLKIAA